MVTINPDFIAMHLSALAAHEAEEMRELTFRQHMSDITHSRRARAAHAISERRIIDQMEQALMSLRVRL